MLREEKELPEGHTAFQRPGLDTALPDPICQPPETLFSLSSCMTASCMPDQALSSIQNLGTALQGFQESDHS